MAKAKKRTKTKKTGAAKSALVVFFTTFDSREEALKFSRQLVERGLAACVNIVPHVSSVYYWQGRVHEDNEIFCIGKTSGDKFKVIKAEIASLHSYRLPELIALPIVSGHEPYLKWLKDPQKKTL